MRANENQFVVSMGSHSLQVVSPMASVRGAVEDALIGVFAISDASPWPPQWTLDVRLLSGGEVAALSDYTKNVRLVVEEGTVEDRLLSFSADSIVLARPETRHGGAYMLKVDHRLRRWTLQIGSDSVRELRWVARLLRLYFGALAQAEGCVFVHAATVEWKGRGILFTGSGGSGKTSLSFLACSRLGARFLSDDTTVVRQGHDGTLSVFGWPRRVALGLSLLIDEPVFAEIRKRSLRREGLDFSMPSQDAISSEWARKNRVAFDPAEFLEIFGFETAPTTRPALVVFPKAIPDHEGWTVDAVQPNGDDELVPRCPLRQLEYVTDFLGVTPHARPQPNAGAVSALEKLPTIAVRYGSSVMADFERFWEDVVCRRLDGM